MFKNLSIKVFFNLNNLTVIEYNIFGFQRSEINEKNFTVSINKMHNNQLSIPSPKSRYHPQLFPTLLNLKSKSNSFYKLLQFQRDKTHSTSKKTYIYI